MPEEAKNVKPNEILLLINSNTTHGTQHTEEDLTRKRCGSHENDGEHNDQRKEEEGGTNDVQIFIDKIDTTDQSGILPTPLSRSDQIGGGSYHP